jgi:AraC family transcriptional regulator
MLETLARIEGRHCTAEFANGHWPQPVEMTSQSQLPIVSMILGRQDYRTEGYYTDTPGAHFEEMGNIFLLAPNREFLGRGPGGDHQIVRIAFTSEDYLPIVSRFHELSDSELRQSLDVGSSMIAMLMRRLVVELSKPSVSSYMLVDSIGSVLLIECASKIFGDDSATGAGVARSRVNYLAAIEDYLAQPRQGSVSYAREIAQLCGYSPSHFAKIFRRETGQTIGRYLADARLRRAKELLATTELPLKEIARQLGFANPANFSTSFTRAVGETPGRYRASHNAAATGDEPS